MSQIGKWFVCGSYTGFLALYVYAAAAYGLTRVAQQEVFECGIGLVFIVWLTGHFLQGKLPRTGIWPWILSSVILAFGWLVTGVGFLSDAIDNGQLQSVADWFPKVLLSDWCSFDPELSLPAMLRTTALMAGMLVAIDLWTDPTRGRILVLTMILSSFGMVIFFLLQTVVGAPFILKAENGTDIVRFATYRYHGNAAAYLNLFWPLSAAAVLFAVIRQTAAWPVWFIPFALTFMATFINISKAGNALAIVGIIVLLGLTAKFASREIKRSQHRIRSSRILVAFIPVLVIAISLPFALPWKRWNYLVTNDNQAGSRAAAYAAFSKMIPVGGLTGFGPGTFIVNYRAYVEDNPALVNQSYWVAHEDYIQTLVEWGYLGTCLWGLFLVPPSLLLLLGCFRKSGRPSREFAGYRIGAVDHLKAFIEAMPSPREACVAAGATTAIILTALHATVDFPMQVVSLQFYFLVLLALGWSYRSKEHPSATEAEP